MKISIAYYRFINPGCLISDFEYDDFKAEIVNNKKKDFYNLKEVFGNLKPYILGHFIGLGLIVALNIKVYYLPTDGAFKVLDVVNAFYAVFFLLALLPIISLLIVIVRGKFYNARIVKLIKKSNNYREYYNSFNRIKNKRVL